ncbi:MAG TPA: GAF domain-containing protein, partial [Myxococcota bacterium]|nr:GAF domain-containing protein [Myxococcota bacterium]
MDHLDELAALRQMLVAVARIQDTFFARADPRAAFDELLDELLQLTGSEYGFIGEVHLDDSGQPYLKTQAITNIAWNEETRAFYEQNVPFGLEFRNLESLFGQAIKTRELVISNDPANDPRRAGVPPGHPPLLAFAGIPFLQAGRLVGMAGLANRAGGYDHALIERLQPVFDTVRTLLLAHRAERDRAHAEAELRRAEIENQARLRL